MSFARGLQCVAVYFLVILQHNGALSQFQTSTETENAQAAHTMSDHAFAGLMGNVVKVTKFLAASSKTSDGTPVITDNEFQTIFDMFYDFLPKEARTGRGVGLKKMGQALSDYVFGKWLGPEPERHDTVKANVGAPLEALLMTSNSIGGWLGKSEHSIFKYPGNLLTDYVSPMLHLAKAFVDNTVDDVLEGNLNAADGRSGILKYIQSAVFQTLRGIGGDFIDKESLKNSKVVGQGSSVLARRIHVLHKELEQRSFGKINYALNFIGFTVSSALDFTMVYIGVRDECYSGKDKLEYEVIQGGSQVSDKYLKGFMETANNARPAACNYYKEIMGPNAVHEIELNIDEFLKVYMDNPASPDTLMVDAVANNMLGDVEPACMLSFLCYAGVNRMKQESEGKWHPGVDLILGITLSGRNNFGGLMDMDRYHKIGNTKMAEALYKGFNNDCGAYDALQGCYDHEEFLNPGNGNQ